MRLLRNLNDFAFGRYIITIQPRNHLSKIIRFYALFRDRATEKSRTYFRRRHQLFFRCCFQDPSSFHGFYIFCSSLLPIFPYANSLLVSFLQYLGAFLSLIELSTTKFSRNIRSHFLLRPTPRAYHQLVFQLHSFLNPYSSDYFPPRWQYKLVASPLYSQHDSRTSVNSPCTKAISYHAKDDYCRKDY